MKPMKKTICFLILSLVVVSGLVFTFGQFGLKPSGSFAPFAFGSVTNHEINNESEPTPKPLSIDEKKANLDDRKKWEASPDGIQYKEWEVSPEGKKVQASYYKIKKDIKAFTDMEAVVTSLTFQRENAGSSVPKWLIVRIKGEEYMMQFIPKDFQQFNSLKVNDKIVVRSRSAGYSPNHPYLILSGDYIEHNTKVLFKRDPSKNNRC
jgi:hypothetical protein